MRCWAYINIHVQAVACEESPVEESIQHASTLFAGIDIVIHPV